MSKKKSISGSVVSAVLTTLLALMALAIVVYATDSYAAVLENMQSNHDARTALAFVSTKIRQNDTMGTMSIEKTDFGADALVIEETDGADVYKTWIYFADGALREFFGDATLELAAEDGTIIIKLNSFTVEQDSDGLIKISVETNSGEKRQISLLKQSNS